MTTTVQPFTTAHRRFVQQLYRTALKSSLDWNIRRDIWRDRAIELRVLFEQNRNVRDPRALAVILRELQEKVKAMAHPDPYRPPLFPDGTKVSEMAIATSQWERNIPPTMFSPEERDQALQTLRDAGLARM